MSKIHSWWRNDPKEVYWLEVTRRPDIGANLKAPQTGENGQPHWSYSLIKHIREGDQIFHYDGNLRTIVACSEPTSKDFLAMDAIVGLKSSARVAIA